MTTITVEGITAEGTDVTVSIETEGGEKAAETVHMHAHDEIVKALQAVSNGVHPDECEGYLMRHDWDDRLEIINAENEQ